MSVAPGHLIAILRFVVVIRVSTSDDLDGNYVLLILIGILFVALLFRTSILPKDLNIGILS
jgi:hypothetical protein